MGFLDNVNLDDAVEQSAVPAGEYKLRIVDVSLANDKNGEPYMLPRFELPEHPTAKEFTKFLRVPHSGLDAKKLNNAKWAMKVFFQAFEIDPGVANADPTSMIGHEGWALLGLEDSAEWGEQNYVKRFQVLPF